MKHFSPSMHPLPFIPTNITSQPPSKGTDLSPKSNTQLSNDINLSETPSNGSINIGSTTQPKTDIDIFPPVMNNPTPLPMITNDSSSPPLTSSRFY